jgi:glycine cleavage system H protein
MSKIEPGLKYTSDHEWIKVLDNGEALVGITDFAQGELGELVYIEVNTVGKTLRQGDIFGTVEAVKTTSDLFIPVGGKVLEFNEAISEKGGDNPGLINMDPYGAGWIIRMEISDPGELDGLLVGDAYAALLH